MLTSPQHAALFPHNRSHNSNTSPDAPSSGPNDPADMPHSPPEQASRSPAPTPSPSPAGSLPATEHSAASHALRQPPAGACLPGIVTATVAATPGDAPTAGTAHAPSAETRRIAADTGSAKTTPIVAAKPNSLVRKTKTSPGAPPGYLRALRSLAEQHTLALWAGRYLAEEVCGVQAANTFEAKSRDLVAFVSWFVELNGSAAIDHWLPRDTQAYLNTLESLGRAATTVNRCFATLRHFARWVNDQPGGIFNAVGLPTRGVQGLTVDEPDCKKLERRDVHRLFKAADKLVLTEVQAKHRPRRNRAILALLYYTGLRVSELVALQRDQYDGRYLRHVKRKGRARSKGLYVSADCRVLLDDYLAHERPQDAESSNETAGALFVPYGALRSLTRRAVAVVLNHIAQEASKHAAGQPIRIYPHRLRHTFGAEYRERTGSDTETAAALGHTGLRYVGRYVRKTQEERERILDGF